MTGNADALKHHLDRLADLVPDSERFAVDELQRRLERQTLRVLVVGEAKRGKSTLINALIGRDILPSGVLPLTAITTTVVYGDDEDVRVRFRDGTTRDALPLAALHNLVTEGANPRNGPDVADVVVSVTAPQLLAGVELVDTPGVGSIHGHNTDEATGALTSMDAAVIVLTADPPISASERRFATEIRASAIRVFCVLNKVDRLSEDERAEAQAFTERVLTEAFGGPVTVWPVSARDALVAAQSTAEADRRAGTGFLEFADALHSYLLGSASADLSRSLAGHALRMANGIAETHAATLATLEVSDEALAATVAEFTRRLNAVKVERDETVSIVRGAIEEILTQTNNAAAALRQTGVPLLTASVQRSLGAFAGPTAAREAQALHDAGEQIRVIVDEWRTVWSAHLDRELEVVDRRLNDRLDAHVAAVRDAAASLFVMTLPPRAPRVRLAASRDFSYRFTPDPGQFDAMAATIRRLLPASWARRRVERYITKRSTSLLDKHIGRARADFQQQLNETRYRLERSVSSGFDEGAGHIAQAITATARLREDDQHLAGLARREAQAGLDAAGQLARNLEPLTRDVPKASDVTAPT